MSKVKDNKRELEILLAVYTFDMNKLSDEMTKADDYETLAGIYSQAAKLISKFAKDIKVLEDGSK